MNDGTFASSLVYVVYVVARFSDDLERREVTAATDSFFFSSLSSFFSTINAEWSSTYCRPSRRDINVVVTIGLLLQNGWLQKALRARDHFEREKIWFCFDFADVVLLYCRDDNSVNPARFEPRLWRRLVPNLHDFYDWAIVLICAILRVFVVFVSSSRCLGVLADILLNRFHLLYYYHRQQSNQNRFIFSIHICVNFTRPWRKCRVYPLSLRVCVFV